MYKKSLLSLLSIVTVSLFVGCAVDSSTEEELVESQKSELIYATPNDISDLNPHLYAGSMHAQGKVFESLVQNTEDGIQPHLAESWKISEDGTTYTFKLREDVTFHDGEVFNAEAVKANIDAIQRNAETHSWIQLSTKIQDVHVIDEFEVALELSEPYYPTLMELSMTRPFVFLSPNDFKGGETKNGTEGFNGTGAYKLTEHVVDDYATFVSFEDYWQGQPEIKTITAKVMPSGETTHMAMQNGEINFSFTDHMGTDSLSVEAMDQLKESGDFIVERSAPMNTKLIVANSSHPSSPIQEREVREAIWHAIDRETIAEDIFGGAETPAQTLFSENVHYADVALPERAYDLELAEDILKKSGWSNSGSSIREKEGEHLSLELHYDSNSSSQRVQAELLQAALSQIGVDLSISGEETASISDRRASGDYEMLFNQTWGLAYDPQSTISSFASQAAYYHTTSGIPDSDRLYDEIKQVMVTTNETEREELYESILQTVHEEAVFIPITNGNVTVVASNNIGNISFMQTQFELPFHELTIE